MHASWVAMARQRIATLLPTANLDADPFPLTKSGQRWLVHVPAPSSLAHSGTQLTALWRYGTCTSSRNIP